MSFVDLMRKVAEVEAIKRIRFTSPHPQEVRSDFIDLVCDSPKVCKHIHMPLQAGSDRILKLMNRNYRKAKYLSIIDAIYSRVPEMSITTDIIVGFPGETESEFLETVEIMKQVEFENSYSFIFSPRPGTVAENLEDPVPYEEKLKWLQHLQKVQEEISGKRLARWVGRQDQILIDGSTSYNPNLMQGRLSQNIVVNLTNQDPSIKPGDFVTVKINRAHRYTLSAETLNSEPQKLSEKNYPLEIELR
jgi:tRNA-2-methylthio-N6-dimethylallyladenosine synthase